MSTMAILQSDDNNTTHRFRLSCWMHAQLLANLDVPSLKILPVLQLFIPNMIRGDKKVVHGHGAHKVIHACDHLGFGVILVDGDLAEGVIAEAAGGETGNEVPHKVTRVDAKDVDHGDTTRHI